MARKSKYDHTEKTPIADLISGAKSDAESLRDEIEDVVSGLEERFSHTERYQTLETTRDELSEVADAGDIELPQPVLDEIGEVEFSWRGKRSPSRADRRDEIVARFEAAKDALDNFIPDKDANEDVEAAAAAADELQQWIDTLQGCEFPGMMG